jgi:tetratricopeptide (TPR) repeat protein
LEEALDKENPETKVLLELGKIAYDAGDFARAAEIFELGHKAEPYDSQWLTQLARVHAQTGAKDKQIAALKELVPLDADDLENRKRLTRLLAEAGDAAGAEKYAREALEISIEDKEAQTMMFKALQDQKKDKELARMKEILGK